MIIKKRIKDVFKVIEHFSKEYNIDEEKRKQIKEIMQKLTSKAVDDLFKELYLHFYVHDENEATQNLSVSNVIAVKDNMFICLLHKIITNNDWEQSDKDIFIRIQKYKKDVFELEAVLKAVLNLVEYTDSRQSLSLNTQKIDALYSAKPSLVVKGAQKSITATLTGKKKNNTFIAHPETKKKNENKEMIYSIVSVEKLGNPYLSLKNKSINLICPICSKKYFEDETTISQRILVKNNEITFKCKHQDKYVVKMPFSINLENHFKGKETNIEKIMFFINNFKLLTKNNKRDIELNES